MTVTTLAEPDAPASDPQLLTRPQEKLGHHVARTVSSLQAKLLASKPRPEAVAALARLRRGLGREPGSDYTLDDYLAVPDELLAELDELPRHRIVAAEKVFDAEYAKHAALTLYALHQQSRQEPMHVDGRGLGTAIADLARLSSGPEGVRRRFAALGTAISYEEALYHLRSLTLMLREHRIPLDYGLLADDLRRLRRPGGRAQMQAAWGREFFRRRPSGESAPAPVPADMTTEATATTNEETEL